MLAVIIKNNPVVSRTGRAAWGQWYGDYFKTDIAWVDNVWSPTANYTMKIHPTMMCILLFMVICWFGWNNTFRWLDYDICMRNLGTTGIALTKTKAIIGTIFSI